MVSLNWALLVYAIYVPAILVLYLFELIAIFKHRRKHFNSSFYKVFSVLAIVNLAATLLGCFVGRLSLYPLVNGFYGAMTSKNAWLTAAYSGSYYLNCLSELLGAFLAFNRYTTLYFPKLHDQFWRWAFFVGVILCFVLAVIPIWNLLDDETMFVNAMDIIPSVDYPWYFLNDVTESSQGSIYFTMAFVTVICNLISFMLYAACLAKLCLFSVSRNSIAERNFFLVGFLTMIFSLPYMGAMLFFGINLSIEGAHVDIETTKFVAYQQPWLTDLKYLTPAPMLLITNSNIRKAIKKMLHRTTSKEVSTLSNNVTIVTLPKIVHVSAR